MKTITIADFEALMPQKPRLYDVREDFEYRLGHIPSAINVPLSQLDAAHLSAFDQSTTNYLICRTGNRSEKACQFLENQGFDVVNILSGMTGYQGEVLHER